MWPVLWFLCFHRCSLNLKFITRPSLGSPNLQMPTVFHLRRFSSPNEGHWSKRSKQRFRELGTRTRRRENRRGCRCVLRRKHWKESRFVRWSHIQMHTALVYSTHTKGWLTRATQTLTQAQAQVKTRVNNLNGNVNANIKPTQEMENFPSPCACVYDSNVWIGQRNVWKYSFHASLFEVETKMASSTTTSDEEFVESVRKHPIR